MRLTSTALGRQTRLFSAFEAAAQKERLTESQAAQNLKRRPAFLVVSAQRAI